MRPVLAREEQRGDREVLRPRSCRDLRDLHRHGTMLTVRAMVLDAPGSPLREARIDDPEPAPGEIVVSVTACGVCRTDLHVVDGELAEPKLPLVLGHQVVGRAVTAASASRRAIRSASRGSPGLRGVPLLPERPREPLRPRPLHRLPRGRRLRRAGRCRRALLRGVARDVRRARGGAAPLRRADRLPRAPPRRRCRAARPLRVRRLGAHRRAGRAPRGPARVRVHARRRGRAQELARSLGAEWAGDALGPAPEELDAAIVFAPAGELVVAALRATAKGGVRRVRRHPHDRHPFLPLRAALGRAGAPLRRKPHTRRRVRVHRARTAGAGPDGGGDVPARGGERRARRGCGPATSAVRPCSSWKARPVATPSIESLYAKHPALREAETTGEHRLESRRPILRLLEPGTTGAELGVFTGLFSEVIVADVKPAVAPSRRPVGACLRRALPRLGRLHGRREADDRRRAGSRRGARGGGAARLRRPGARDDVDRLARIDRRPCARLGVCRLDARV